MTESVELATVLFVDLVGSTQLATAVGPTRADELREEYFGLLREAVASADGREVKNLGDGLMVAFSSASAGVGCAVLMQQLFERRYRRAEQQLHVRIGLGTGESTISDGDYFGMPTIEAARLCDKAPTAGIFASPATRMLAGRVQDARFESVGELELKGIPEPVEAFAVIWEPFAEESAGPVGRWPLPAVLRSVPPVSYVGRSEERGWLERLRAVSRGGERRLVLLSGEPGIGKTRLASFAALGAHADGFAVCWGACSEDLGAPYGPWIEACSQLVEHAPEELLASYVGRYGGELSRLARNLPGRVGELPAPQSSDPETERFLLFNAVAGLLGAVCEAVPVCLVLDDFHWADGQSVALLKHVAKTVERAALLVLVTYRDSDLGKEHPLTGVLADLRRVEGVERLTLTGLGVDDVSELTAIAAGHELDAAGVALAGEITSETGGNPFFVIEILRNLSEAGIVVLDEASGRWRIDHSSAVGLPASVRDVVERRVEKLGESTREVLTAAAVIGRSFEVELLAPLVEISESELLDRLEAAASASLLIESSEHVGRFQFAHALINHTLYQGLGGTRRARMHQRVAEVLEQSCGEDPGDRVGELARHWAAATVPTRAGKAIDYARRAGEQALAALAPGEAVEWFRHALELYDAQPGGESLQRCELLIGLGTAGREAGVSFRRTLLEASRIALELEDDELLVGAVLANHRGGRTSFITRVDQARIELLEAAEQRTQSGQPATRARLLSVLALELVHGPDYHRRRALSDEAVELARRSADQRALAEVLRDRLYAIWVPGSLTERRANVLELLELTARLDDPALHFWACLNDMDIHAEAGEIADAREALERCQRIAEQTGHPRLKWAAASQAACLATLNGSAEEIEAAAQRVLALGLDSAEPDAASVSLSQVGHAFWLQARWDELLAITEQGVSLLPIAALHSCLGTFLLEAGQHLEAGKVLDEAKARGLDRIQRDPLTTGALSYYATLAWALRDQSAAADLFKQLGTEPVVWQGVCGYGASDVYRGILAATLGRDDEADARLAAGIELNDRIGATHWAIRGRLCWAELLEQRGEADSAERAAQLFGRAHDDARAFAAPALLERAEAGLARAATV